MATKAELEAELAHLRQRLKEETAGKAAAAAAEEAPAAATAGVLDGLLDTHAVQGEDLEKLWDQLMQELNDLPERKPLLTAGVAFALGFLLGRASK